VYRYPHPDSPEGVGQERRVDETNSALTVNVSMLR